jgi:hypothetical protein
VNALRKIWIRFDESDRRAPAPQFELQTPAGSWVALSDFRGRQNLVLYFDPILGGGVRVARDLQAFARLVADYDLHDARVLAVLSGSPPDSAGLDALLILQDPAGSARRDYAALLDASLVSDQDSLLFILDRFGAPYAAQAAGSWDQIEKHAEIIGWLDFIGMLCPE